MYTDSPTKQLYDGSPSRHPLAESLLVVAGELASEVACVNRQDAPVAAWLSPLPSVMSELPSDVLGVAFVVAASQSWPEGTPASSAVDCPSLLAALLVAEGGGPLDLPPLLLAVLSAERNSKRVSGLVAHGPGVRSATEVTWMLATFGGRGRCLEGATMANSGTEALQESSIVARWSVPELRPLDNSGSADAAGGALTAAPAALFLRGVRALLPRLVCARDL